MLDIAETTITGTTPSPSRTWCPIMLATRLIRSPLPTDVPPNFKTCTLRSIRILPGWKMQRAKPSASSNMLCRYRFAGFERRGFQRLVQIIDQVVNGLQADGEADEIGRHACLLLLFGCQLGVRRAGRMDDERLGITHIRQV